MGKQDKASQHTVQHDIETWNHNSSQIGKIVQEQQQIIGMQS
jgi:hypothetical protein